MCIFSMYTYKHRRAQIELVEKLSYENMNLENVCYIFALHVSQDVNEPLEVLVRWANPEKIYLSAENSRCFFIVIYP